ncbi:MAG: DUF484 family protein [Gammaproteobacteria bacterium]|nr:DUF484 family protein [Gammaproteobacteria bacterium]
MSKLGNASTPGLRPDEVAAYLRENPDFFDLHADLLLELRVPHGEGEGAVSLVERQLELLRRRNEELRRTLEEYIENARSSDMLASQLNQLVTKLLSCSGPDERLRSLPGQLKEIFSLDFVHLLLFDASPERCAGIADLSATPRQDVMAEGLSGVLKANAPRCGQYSDQQRRFLFGDAAPQVGSVALAPLGGRGKLGLLALGSCDPNHYHRAKSTEFLGRVSAVVSVAISPNSGPL